MISLILPDDCVHLCRRTPYSEGLSCLVQTNLSPQSQSGCQINIFHVILLQNTKYASYELNYCFCIWHLGRRNLSKTITCELETYFQDSDHWAAGNGHFFVVMVGHSKKHDISFCPFRFSMFCPYCKERLWVKKIVYFHVQVISRKSELWWWRYEDLNTLPHLLTFLCT